MTRWREVISRYQRECEAALSESLAAKGLAMRHRRVDIVVGLDEDRPEAMITGEVPELSAKVWIYTNQVDIITPTSELRLEEWGARTPAEHIEKVVHFVCQLPIA